MMFSNAPQRGQLTDQGLGRAKAMYCQDQKSGLRPYQMESPIGKGAQFLIVTVSGCFTRRQRTASCFSDARFELGG